MTLKVMDNSRTFHDDCTSGTMEMKVYLTEFYEMLIYGHVTSVPVLQFILVIQGLSYLRASINHFCVFTSPS